MPMKSREGVTLSPFPEAIMAGLSSGQRKFLRSKAHHLKPLVLVGKQGLTDTLVDSVNVNLEAHELIKVRFNEHKEEKRDITDAIAERTESEIAGILGHVAILYRPRKDPEKRTIKLPVG
jgi:RNA-binding protein